MNYGRRVWGIVVNLDFNLTLNYCNWVKKCFFGAGFTSLSLTSEGWLCIRTCAASASSNSFNCSQESLLSLTQEELCSRADWEEGHYYRHSCCRCLVWRSTKGFFLLLLQRSWSTHEDSSELAAHLASVVTAGYFSTGLLNHSSKPRYY